MKLIRYSSQPAAWSPLDRLASLRDLLDSTFDVAHAPASGTRGWVPALDVSESPEAVTVRLDAAGLKKEDFDLSLHDDTLTISGERRAEESPAGGESFRRERFFGRFSRTVTLPSPVKADGVAATYQDGVLTVVLPKAESARPRRIAVE